MSFAAKTLCEVFPCSMFVGGSGDLEPDFCHGHVVLTPRLGSPVSVSPSTATTGAPSPAQRGVGTQD